MGITNLDRLELDGKEIYPAIDAQTTKTVGSGKDFQTFHEAMSWACKQPMTSGGSITLVLDDGTHYIGEPEDFNNDWWIYYLIRNYIVIKGASEDKSLCTLTLPPADDGNNYPEVFYVIGGKLSIAYITVDLDVGGYPYPKTAALGYSDTGGRMRMTYSTLKNAYYGPYTSTGEIYYRSCLLDNIEGDAMSLSGQNGTIVADATTISNCGVAVNLVTDFLTCCANVIKIRALTLTNNTTDYGKPLNEIQYEGSYITDNSAALSFKA